MRKIKGKKFDAAEKHFKEKEIKIKREMTGLKEKANALEYENKVLKGQVEDEYELRNQLIDKIYSLETANEKLVKLMNLEDVDIKAYVEKEVSITRAAKSIEFMCNMKDY